MEQKELYPELIDHIINYFGRYFLEKEIKANDHFFALGKSNNGANTPMFKYLQERGKVSSDEKVLAMIENGFEKFKLDVATRIYNDNKEQLELNLCPVCGKIARTPYAKQCRFCFHDWHTKINSK
jgi:hypothetical protein